MSREMDDPLLELPWLEAVPGLVTSVISWAMMGECSGLSCSIGDSCESKSEKVA